MTPADARAHRPLGRHSGRETWDACADALGGRVSERRPAGPLEPTDDALMLFIGSRMAGAEGAEASLAILYDRYGDAVYRLGLRLLGDTGRAEDLVQETFWRVWRHADWYEPGRVRFTTWLLRIATNQAISEHRRAAVRPGVPHQRSVGNRGDAEAQGATPEPAAPGSGVPEQVWQAELRRVVAVALATLPPVQRQAVRLAYLSGCTHAEIAAAQGAPLSTVKTRLILGLKKLRTVLEGHGLTAADAET